MQLRRVQPTTGLLERVHYVPRAATLSNIPPPPTVTEPVKGELARGYPSLSPTDIFFIPCHSQ